MSNSGPDAYLLATPLRLARRWLGVHEKSGHDHNPRIQAWLQLATGGHNSPEMADEIPWCSAFVYEPAYLLELPRPDRPALRARAWLKIGQWIPLEQARPGFDIVITKRGHGVQPGPDVIDAQGHVAFFDHFGASPSEVVIFGGNQGDAVCEQTVPVSQILGVRRLSHA